MIQIHIIEKEKRIIKDKKSVLMKEEIGRGDVGRGEVVINQRVNNEMVHLIIITTTTANTYKVIIKLRYHNFMI